MDTESGKNYPVVTAEVMALFFHLLRNTKIALWHSQDVHPVMLTLPFTCAAKCVKVSGAQNAWDSFFNQRS